MKRIEIALLSFVVGMCGVVVALITYRAWAVYQEHVAMWNFVNTTRFATLPPEVPQQQMQAMPTPRKESK